jgi:carboxymethylenebutenolidase
MCDELTEKDNENFLAKTGQLNRRNFTVGTSAMAMLAILTGCKEEELDATSVVEAEVDVPMQTGVSDCYFAHRAEGKHPGILMWTDIKGLRPAFKAMGKRLAMAGYIVLVVNPFYRNMKHPVVGPDASFSDPETRKFLFGLAANVRAPEAAASDARDYIAFLDAQASVDTSRKIGTAGYCMGGPLIMRTAAAVPDRVGAAASFHGGGLVTDTPDSPHLLIANSPAAVLHAVAENDDEKDPNAKIVLADTYKAAGIPAEIEVYEGAMHGWCPPDSPVYNEAQAERAWTRMLDLFATYLA